MPVAGMAGPGGHMHWASLPEAGAAFHPQVNHVGTALEGRGRLHKIILILRG